MVKPLPVIVTAPYCIVTVFFFFWSIAAGCLAGRIRFWDMKSARNDLYAWTTICNSFLGVVYRKVGSNSLHKKERCVYMCNHRSWADFFVDTYLTEGGAAPMARMMVYAAFPSFMTSIVILKSVVLFKRGAIADKTTFNKWLDEKLEDSPVPNLGLLVYPEGHRSIKSKPLPLKRGMVYYAHSRELPIQVIVTRGKELILSEKERRAGFGVQLSVGFSDVVSPKGLSFDEFAAEVQKTWEGMWEKVYDSNLAELPLLKQEDVPAFDYPASVRYQQCAWCIFSVLCMFAALMLTWKLALLVMSPLPSTLQDIIIAMFTGIVLMSFKASIVDNDEQNIKLA